ncbi:hypothetical protein NW757_013834 [Fusarium falciforme]|nr:hypothetical protein NW757_013834 [Fusarium falciforme]
MSSPAPDGNTRPAIQHSLALPREHANLNWRRERGVRKFYDKTGHFPCELAPQCCDTYWDAFTFLERILTLGVKLSEQDWITFDDVKAYLAERVKYHKPKAQTKLQLSDVDSAIDHFFSGAPNAKQAPASRAKRSLFYDLEEESVQVSPKRQRIQEVMPLNRKSIPGLPPASIAKRPLYSSDSTSSSKSFDDSDTDKNWSPRALRTDTADNKDSVHVNTVQNGSDKTEKTVDDASGATSRPSVQGRPPVSGPVDGNNNASNVNANSNSSSAPASTLDIPPKDHTITKTSQSNSSARRLSRSAAHSATPDSLDEVRREMDDACRKCSEAVERGAQRLERLLSDHYSQRAALQSSLERAKEVHQQLGREHRINAKAQVEAASKINTNEGYMELIRKILRAWQEIAGSDASPSGWIRNAIEEVTKELAELDAERKEALREHGKAAAAFQRTRRQMEEAGGEVNNLKSSVEAWGFHRDKLQQECRAARFFAGIVRLGPRGIWLLEEEFPGFSESIGDILKDVST